MAQPVYCSSEDDRLALVILSNLDTGDSDAFCADCWRDAVVSMAGAFLEALAPPAEGGGEDHPEGELGADADESGRLEPEADELPEEESGRHGGAGNGAGPPGGPTLEEPAAPLTG